MKCCRAASLPQTFKRPALETPGRELPQRPTGSQKSDPPSPLKYSRLKQEGWNKADTSSKEEYFDPGGSSRGFGGIERAVGGYEGSSSCWMAAQGTNMSFSPLLEPTVIFLLSQNKLKEKWRVRRKLPK